MDHRITLPLFLVALTGCPEPKPDDTGVLPDPVEPIELSEADGFYTGTEATEHAGTWVTWAGDMDDDGSGDLAIGAEFTNRAGIGTDAGAVYVMSGPLPVGEFDLSTASTIIRGETAGDQFGSRVAGGGDVNGDGIADLLISGKRNDAGVATLTGSAYLFFGPLSPGELGAEEADVILRGVATFDFTGIYLSFAGDVLDDGYDDILVAANNADPGGRGNAGTVYLVRGGPGLADMSLADADATFHGEVAFDFAGIPANAGDVDGDGIADFVIGVPDQDLEGTRADAGKVYLFLGGSHLDGLSVELSAADAIFTGSAQGDRLGTALVAAGDVDGDGLDDLFLGAPQVDEEVNNGGAVYVILGSSIAPGTVDMGSADARLLGDRPESGLGSALAGDFDYDGDGLPDLLAGAPRADGNRGAAYLFLAPFSGAQVAAYADAAYLGERVEDYAGRSLAFAEGPVASGDPGGVLVGAPQHDLGAADGGTVFLFLGIP